jgi:alpha-tubulin suppressor-like RCC1 family protein
MRCRTDVPPFLFAFDVRRACAPGRRLRLVKKAVANAALVIGLALVAGSPGCTDVTGPAAASVELVPTSLLLYPDSTVQLSATAFDVGGHALSTGVSWSSSNHLAATVSGTGLVRAVAPGYAWIFAMSGGAADSVAVTVQARPIALVVGAEPDSILTGGTSLVGSFLVVPVGSGTEPFEPRSVAWSVSDSSLARVVPNYSRAVVVGLRPGRAVITGTAEGLTGTVTVRVLAHVASVRIAPDSLRLVIGDDAQLGVASYDSTGQMLSGRPVTWSASGHGFVVSAAGLVSTTTAGSGTVIASVEGKTDTVGVRSAFDAPVRRLAAAYSHACVETSAGTMYCWGIGGVGQLATGTTAAAEPTGVRTAAGTPAFADLVAAGSTACGITAGGQAWCWGSDVLGSLGSSSGVTDCGAGNRCRGTPAPAADTLRVTHLGVGTHVCGLAEDGSLWCWGSNYYGQFGNGTLDSTEVHSSPVRAGSGQTFASLATGDCHTCALDRTGTAFCWGLNDRGQLGRDPAAGSPAVPQPVAGGLSFSSISAGPRRTCAITPGGDVWCWGAGSFSPRTVPGAPRMMAVVASGWDHVCGLGADSLAYCWGDNSYGQLGIGTTGGYSDAAVIVSGGLHFESIAAGMLHTCAVTAAGLAYCWGDGSMYQLGTFPVRSSAVPLLIEGQR